MIIPYLSPDGQVYWGDRQGRVINGVWVWDEEIPEPPEEVGWKYDVTQKVWVKDKDYLLEQLQIEYESRLKELKE